MWVISMFQGIIVISTKKGYTWRYSYSENGKRYDIQRVKLGDLEKEVKRRNLKWKRIDNGGDLNIV